MLAVVLVGAAAACGHSTIARTTPPGTTSSANARPAANTTIRVTTAPTAGPVASTTAPTAGPVASTTAPTAGPVASTTAPTASTVTTSGQPSAPVELSENDSGRSVTIQRGESITVVLHSTYWSMLTPSNPTVLEQQGSPIISPRLQGCVPGQGCGTVAAHYLAVATGQSQLAANRETCGEALLCAPDKKNWRVTVTVT
jgi:hypothetical protein